MDKQKLVELRQAGYTYKAIAQLFGVSKQRVYQLVKPLLGKTRNGKSAPPEEMSKRWREMMTQSILARDGYKCKLCGNADRLLAHHIDGDAYHNDPMNMITLCHDCHGSCHVKHGRDEVNNRLKGLISE